MPACPYCGHEFDRMPARKRACPSCRRTVFPRRSPGESEKRLVTEEDAERIEEAWAEHHQRAWWATMMHITSDHYDEVRRQARDRRSAESTLAEELLDEITGGDPRLFTLALWFKDHGDRERAAELFRVVARARLAAYEGDGLHWVKLVATRTACPACAAQDGQIWAITDAYRLMPVPCADCTSHYGHCRCIFVPWREGWEP